MNFFVNKKLHQHMPFNQQQISPNAQAFYQGVIWIRRSVMIISSSLLLINIYMIIKSKQYKYNTLKLFLFLELFTVLGQLIVIPHGQYFQGGWKYISDDSNINQVIEDIISDSPANILPCAIQAYFNLCCYNISYLFALLITLYVRRVIDNTHKYFMHKHKKVIIYSVIATMLVYLPPFVLSFFKQMPYSFGPVGFKIMDRIFQGEVDNYLFYCAITNRSDDGLAKSVSIINMVLVPAFMFIVHSILLWKNRKSMKFLKGLEQLNPRQWFILKSGTLSLLVFIFQSINFTKFILSLFTQDSPALIVTVDFLNMGFDFLPIFLVFIYYKKYYQRGKKLQQNSLIRTVNDQSLVTNSILAN